MRFPRTLLIDCLLAVATWLRRGSSLLVAMAAGACDRRELHARTLRYWDGLVELQARDHTLSGLMEWEERAYGRFLPEEGKLGLIGCGTGREAIALADRGHRVVGVDSSEVCLRKARENIAAAGSAVTFLSGDIADFDFPEGRYSAFVFTWYIYCYIPGSSTRVGVLERLARRLTAGGRILLSVPRTDLFSPVASPRAARWTARLTFNPRTPEPRDRYLVRTLGDGGLLWMAALDRRDIESEAKAAGLRTLHWVEYEEEDRPAVAVLAPDTADGKQAS